jgi:ferredoxin
MGPGRVPGTDWTRTGAAFSRAPRRSGTMAFIITSPCIGTKDTACVDVCPVDCIHPTKDEPEFESSEMLYIDPEECIDCGACEPACPVEAIFEEDAVPDDQKDYIQKNADWYKNR